ncbi:uncharacterized protein LOC142172426 [Nicotiana tabacum]|uniref:Uncharacterized protein LOC142172426 n=1 Tax=Nicotiana tabacum TaxID=4097 RepID=A0AC58T4K6_TOBAC
MVISWILNSLDSDISQSVIYSKTAKGLWDELNQYYGQSNGARMYEVQKDLSSVSQGYSDVSGCFNKVKRLWDEIESLNTESYCNQKYNFTTPNQYQRGNSDAKRAPDPRKPFCRYCKKSGHVLETCYKLHGYPQNFKFGNKNIRVAANVYSNSEVADEGQNQFPTASVNFAGPFSEEAIETCRGTWTHLLSSKGNALSSLKSFFSMVETQFNVKIKTIRTDNALELGASLEATQFFQSKGVLHRISCPYTPQQNVPKPLRDKFSPRSTPCIFFGYPPGKKAYKLLQLSNKKILISRDVIFHENIFSYSESTSPKTLFSGSSNSSDFGYPPHHTPSSHQHIPSPQQNIPAAFPHHNTPSSFAYSPLQVVSTPSSVHSSSAPPSLSVSPVHTPENAPRYPSRPHHLPSYLRDYVCGSVFSSSPFTLTYVASFPKSVCFSSLSSTNQDLLKALNNVHEPTIYQQATQHPAWQEAMLKEFEAFESNAT